MHKVLVAVLLMVTTTGVGHSYVLQHSPSGFKVAYSAPNEVNSSYDPDGIMAYAKAWDSGNVAQYTVSQPFAIVPDCGGNAVEEIDVEFNIIHTKQGNPFGDGCSTLNTVTPWIYLFVDCGVQNTTRTLSLKTNTVYRLETNAFAAGDGTAAVHEYRSEIRLKLPADADSSPPSIAIHAPAGTYFLNQAVAADYTCTDCGSGVDQCIGSVVDGTPFDTSTVGTHSFHVTATDKAGLSAAASIEYRVAYRIKSLHDRDKCKKEGSTIPIKIQLADADDANVLSEDVEVTALHVRRLPGGAPQPAEDSGKGVFRSTNFDGSPGYIFNLKTTGLASGNWVLVFKVGDDSILYETEFCIR